MHIRVLNIKVSDCLEQITVQCCLCCTDINGPVLKADQIIKIILGFEKLSTACCYILIENLSLRSQFHATFASGKQSAP